VAQEALTNVLRHAGRAAASVLVQWGEKLVITVTDDGCGGPVPRQNLIEVAAGADLASVVNRGGVGAVAGRGLLGLRERLSLYGGELDAGPRAGGGWQVRAVMPVGQGPGGW
jgi:signal transduction histidine kinase